jgi:hypothetical protein
MTITAYTLHISYQYNVGTTRYETLRGGSCRTRLVAYKTVFEVPHPRIEFCIHGTHPALIREKLTARRGCRRGG